MHKEGYTRGSQRYQANAVRVLIWGQRPQVSSCTAPPKVLLQCNKPLMKIIASNIIAGEPIRGNEDISGRINTNTKKTAHLSFCLPVSILSVMSNAL